MILNFKLMRPLCSKESEKGSIDWTYETFKFIQIMLPLHVRKEKFMVKKYFVFETGQKAFLSFYVVIINYGLNFF